jgi:hypothetical protein
MTLKTLPLSLLLLASLFLPVLAGADDAGNPVTSVNRKVELLDRAIAAGEYPLITVENDRGATEGLPPVMRFYYERESEQLVAAFITAGHESWSKSFSYYFDGDENILKYLVVIDRMDDPPREAVLYDGKGGVLWKNTELPSAEPREILAFFRKAMSYQDVFSRY